MNLKLLHYSLKWDYVKCKKLYSVAPGWVSLERLRMQVC